MRVWARTALTWKGNSLHIGGKGNSVLAIEPDARWPGMWRVQLSDGSLSDMVNLTRARDAAMSIARRLLQIEETASGARRTAMEPSAGLPEPAPL